VVENFRPGVLARLGLQYDDLRAVNEQIILCSISGFGQDSSYRDKPSYDVITQAMSGAMSVTGEPGRPPVRLGIPMGDLSGGLFGALAILAALNERRTTGRGQALDVSMLDGLVHLMLYYPVDYLNANKLAGPVGGRHEHVAPYGVFATSDGYIVLAIFSGKFWRQYCQAVERPDLPEDERFLNASDRLTRRVELYEILDEVMLTKTTAEWEALMDEYGVPHSPILTVDQVAIHPLMREREMFVDVDHPVAGRVKVSGRPIKFHERQHPMQPAPLLGQHTREVLAEVAGTPLELIEQLERDGVIASVEVDVGSGPVSEVRA
jgi:crotonobetainyl-CoA:carnitine CoA-transferase CaiB-like acyl-CoA transferase